MSNRQWLNPLITMLATALMCALLAATHEEPTTNLCLLKTKHHHNVMIAPLLRPTNPLSINLKS